MAIGTGVKRAIFLGPKSLNQSQGTISFWQGLGFRVLPSFWQNSIDLWYFLLV